MKIKETKEVTEKMTVTIGIKCDVCGNEHKGKYAPDEWHNIEQHHNDWGNDSCDSYEYFDVCSPKCYAIRFKKSVGEMKSRRSAEVDGFEIQFAIRLADVL
jgi:hypothetical protein